MEGVKVVVVLVCGAVLSLWFGVRLINMLIRPRQLMERGGTGLSPCPPRPNCACSCADEEGVATGGKGSPERMAPIRYTGDPQDVIEKLESLVLRLPRARVVERQTQN